MRQLGAGNLAVDDEPGVDEAGLCIIASERNECRSVEHNVRDQY